MVVKKARPLAIECVVRGYLTGSGWKDYQKTGCVCGIKLPSGLQNSCRLPAPVFTPRPRRKAGMTKTFPSRRPAAIAGADVAEKARDLTLKIYCFAADFALKRGIIIADTKFEFGLHDGELILIDEVLTPDSSRFWPADQYERAAASPVSTSSLCAIIWKPFPGTNSRPRPPFRRTVIAKTTEKYLEAYRRLTGKSL